MSAAIIQLGGTSEIDEAWAAYSRLCRAESDNEALKADRAHVEARVAAHVRFCELYARQCRRENVVPLDGVRP